MFNILIRIFSHSFASGLEFKIQYESTNVSNWSYNFGACMGNFTTPNGILTSPFFPGYHPNGVDCIYSISQPTGTIILLKFLSIDIEYDSKCSHNYLEITYGSENLTSVLDKLCGSDLTHKYNHNQLRIK